MRKRRGPSAAVRDISAVLAVTLLVSLIAARVELSERLVAWTRPYEHWQLDELILTLVALSLGLAWFAYRRGREARAEVAARRRSEERIRGLLTQNRQLARQLLRLQENERRALARELHDELGQLCNAIKVDAVSISRRRDDELATVHATARSIVEAADRIHDIVRSWLRRLRPRALDELGLIAAVQEQLETWEQRHRIACTFVPEGRLDDLGEAVNMTVYRIVQECLSNIARHAQARHITVDLQRLPAAAATSAGDEPTLPRRNGHWVRLRIEDDGRGIDWERTRKGLGLAGMKERIAALGGILRFTSRPGSGTCVEVAIPTEV